VHKRDEGNLSHKDTKCTKGFVILCGFVGFIVEEKNTYSFFIKTYDYEF